MAPMREESSDRAITQTDVGARTWSYVVELVFWVVLFLACALLLLKGWPGSEFPDSLGSLIARLAGAFGAAWSVMLGRNVVRLLREDRPTLQISEEGVLNRTYSASAGFVPWEEILEIRRTRLPTVLEIVLRDPQAFRKRQTLTTRILMRSTSLFGSGPLLVYLPRLRRPGPCPCSDRFSAIALCECFR